MADPILSAITDPPTSPPTINLVPGASVTFQIVATDPDAGTSTLHFEAADGEGNTATLDVVVQKSDPIQTWVVTSDDPDIVGGFTAQGGTGATVVASWPNS